MLIPFKPAYKGPCQRSQNFTYGTKATVDVTKLMNLNICEVGILRANSGLVLMEVNSSPDLNSIKTATDKNIPSMTIQFLEKNVKLTLKTRGKDQI